ncbi:acetylcholine receptor subunit gamma isoform X1 [Corythoichthys intestinalis]|uniref:acetylcholine receptor subunit gamma isoform X1 n=1 Tax=Corythoichthys intestinalis TaxID=161448 RepID=UPI0025A5C389|nr:acetylcholine receptor subunit gamma isoform X1 [Corythoichthys intestinalis]XP_061795305.1 acetylcholine receptor subunit gamma-like [Nerophis lumbriciformis]
MDSLLSVPFLMKIVLISASASALNLEGELFKDLMEGYNKNVRPVENFGDVTQVDIKMTLTNLISLNEKEEALTTSVWIEMQWCDYRLRWDQPPRSALYKNITSQLRVPSKNIWLPGVVLENNVDGQFEVALYSNALVSPNGCVYWLPPAIYRSACAITINYFPFDWQNCTMVFRSQNYSANEIELVLKKEDNQILEWIDIDPEAFTENGEWVIKHRPAKKVINSKYSKDDLEYQELVFFLIIQRKPLFYIINIIAPCVLFSSLCLLVYYLPAKAGGQKCTMSIATLLGQTVFLFLIAKKVPETSKAVPLIEKYLMFVMSVTTMVVMNCVISLNVSLRTPNTHVMSDKVRKILLNILPRLLRMQMQPWTPDHDTYVETSNGDATVDEVHMVPCRRRSSMTLINKAEEYTMKTARTELMFARLKERNGLMKSVFETLNNGLEGVTAERLSMSLAKAAPELRQCVASCKHIAETTRQQKTFKHENEEWIRVARVIDRVCFIVMALLFFAGTITIFLLGHFNQPPPTPFLGDPKKYLPMTNNLTEQPDTRTGVDILG